MPKFKKLGLSGIHAIRADFEKYFNDHFGFRNYFVRANSLLAVGVLGTSPTPDVVIGRDGWLFYNAKEEGGNLPDFYGRSLFPAQRLDTMGKYAAWLQGEMDKRGIQFLIVMAPNKHTIYPEYLPRNVLAGRGQRTRADQLDELLAAKGVDFLDLRETLLKSKGAYPYNLYYKTDTHWNDLGAFIGYRAIMEDIGKRRRDLPILKPEDFTIAQKENGNYLDLAGFIGMGGEMEDKTIVMTPKSPYRAVSLAPDLSYLPAGDYQSKVFRGGAAKAPKLLMFRDSFIVAPLPFFAESFSNSVYVWQLNVDFNIVDKEKPDIVILEFVERSAGLALTRPSE
jgi:hypothetical protein